MNLFGALLGALLTLASWLVLVPWDLSEVDASGRATGTGDDAWIRIGGVLLITAVAGIIVALIRKDVTATFFTALGSGVWAVLFAWRAGTAETAGASLWMVPLLFLVLPGAIVVSVAVHLTATWRHRSLG